MTLHWNIIKFQSDILIISSDRTMNWIISTFTVTDDTTAKWYKVRILVFKNRFKNEANLKDLLYWLQLMHVIATVGKFSDYINDLPFQ